MGESLKVLDEIHLNFNEAGLFVLNLTLAFIMFGVALGLKVDNFKRVIFNPKSAVIGVFSQFVLMPAMTFLLVIIINPGTSVAMGMILVAACPGGNISNFITSLAKGNVELSVSLTGIADLSAIIMTPFNFAFWAGLYSLTSDMVIPIQIDIYEMFKTMMLLLALPITIGMFFSYYFPKITKVVIKPIKIMSIIIFLGYIVGALSLNIDYFLEYIHLIVLIVLIHNALALTTGFTMAKLFRLSDPNTRTITIETGIQNSGLGLVLIFNPNLFNGLGGMAFIAAWWGIWHIISGLAIGFFWGSKPVESIIEGTSIS
ncbi:MAG: bile acid:sodium symporter family protein [Bacteroidetes bacterium]|nr:MAG: bile acid:sodium symporter family protein [Bacteroidota bacterium]